MDAQLRADAPTVQPPEPAAAEVAAQAPEPSPAADGAPASCTGNAGVSVQKSPPQALAQPARVPTAGTKVKTFTRKPTVTAAAARRERCRKRHFLKKSIARVQDMNPEAQQAAFDEARGTGPVRAVGTTGAMASQALIAPVAPRPLDTHGADRSDRTSWAGRPVVLRPWQDAPVQLRSEAQAAPLRAHGSSAHEQQSQRASSSAQTALPRPEGAASASDRAGDATQRAGAAAAESAPPFACLSWSDHLRHSESDAHSIASGLCSPEFDDVDMLAALPRLSDSSAMSDSGASSPAQRLSDGARCCGAWAPDEWDSQWPAQWGRPHHPDEACTRALRRHPSRAHCRASASAVAAPPAGGPAAASVRPACPRSVASPVKDTADLQELLQRLPDPPGRGASAEERPLPLFSSPSREAHNRRLRAQQGATDSSLSASLDTQAVMAALSAREASGDLCCSPLPSAPSSPLFKAAQNERAVCAGGDAPTARRNGLDFGVTGVDAHHGAAPNAGARMLEPRIWPPAACTRDQLAWQSPVRGGAVAARDGGGAVPSAHGAVHTLCTTMMLAHLEHLGLSPTCCEPWLDTSGRIASHMLRMDCVPPEANRDMAFLPVDSQVRSICHLVLQKSIAGRPLSNALDISLVVARCMVPGAKFFVDRGFREFWAAVVHAALTSACARRCCSHSG